MTAVGLSLEPNWRSVLPVARSLNAHIPTQVLESNNLSYTPSKSQSFAEWVCSRESLFRFGLDMTGWVLPSLIGAATRNWYSFAEALFQSALEVVGMGCATNFIKLSSIIAGKLHLSEDENKNLKHYMMFQRNDMDSEASMIQAAARLKEEEVEDIGFLAGMDGNKVHRQAQHQERIQSIENFFSNFSTNPAQIERLKKFKKSVIMGESIFESVIWGGYFLYNRLFRKYVLGQDRFTGTKAYLNDNESKKVGDSTRMSLFQKFGAGLSILSSPLLNMFILNKLDDKEAVAKNSWLQTIKSQWDVTHGLYPKLGLQYSYIFLPCALSALFSAQGKSEFIEQLLTQLIMGNSWFFGHRLTNGVLAQCADQALAKKHGVAPGILVEKDYLHHPTPEPAKIQHVLKQVRGNPALERDARTAHARTVYWGFGLHSALVLGVRLLINQFTKWRVRKDLG